MSNIFYPKKSIFLSASKPHPDNTQYKVSIGDEDWDGELHTVIKVQLVYNGKIAGRINPSFPYDSADAENVADAIAKLKREYAVSPEVRVIPALPMTEVSNDYYITLIQLVPSGCITRWEDIEFYLIKKFRVRRITPAYGSIWPYWDFTGKDIPYWRIVGPYGYLFSRSDKYTLEQQERLLVSEGLSVEPCGAGKRSKRVSNYKKYLFDFKSVPDNAFDAIPSYKRFY